MGSPRLGAIRSRNSLSEELAQYFTQPLLQLSAGQELARIGLYTEQITDLEQLLLKAATAPSAFERLQEV